MHCKGYFWSNCIETAFTVEKIDRNKNKITNFHIWLILCYAYASKAFQLNQSQLPASRLWVERKWGFSSSHYKNWSLIYFMVPRLQIKWTKKAVELTPALWIQRIFLLLHSFLFYRFIDRNWILFSFCICCE